MPHAMLMPLDALLQQHAPEPSLPIEEAQLDELIKAFDSYNLPLEIIPLGSRVYEKHGLRQMRSRDGNQRVFILWRQLSPFDENDREIISQSVTRSGNVPDCVLAGLDPDGDIEFYMHQRRRLTMTPPLPETPIADD